MCGCLSAKTCLHKGNVMEHRHTPKQMPLKEIVFVVVVVSPPHPVACHAPAILPCDILPCCLGCEWSWACVSKLLTSSETRTTAGVGITSWQPCKVDTETLHQVRASTPFQGIWGRQGIAKNACMCIGTNVGGIVTMREGYSHWSQYGQELPALRGPSATQCFV